ncbi:MAG: radical SAM protein [Deltaproteobacteria bacterium]|nr:radical SAM protein [Deltaproteobacteria bacterium]MBW2050854.1 radical SAM protein [Deltaproteobacteria bacterium]
MRYQGPVYRPPSEAGSLLIQATLGCPHNKCRFCSMYKNKRFKIRLLRDIFEDLDRALEFYGSNIHTLFLPDGNTIVVKTSSLIKIIERARRNFPELERITVYGSARFLLLKKIEELKALREAGLSRVHMGLESGDDEVLKEMEKGATAAECAEAGRKVKEAGIELSVYYLLGLGGLARLEEHARKSAEVINAIGPDFIRIRTLSPLEGTPLYSDYLSGHFTLPSPHEAMRELKYLVEGLEGPFMLLSDHINNYLNLTGKLPDDKKDFLAEIEAARECDDSWFVRRLMVL